MKPTGQPETPSPMRANDGVVRPAWWWDLPAAALAAGLLLALWHRVPLIDDGAIVLRYMDNFAAGHLYAYNPADGPVFGISGFLHGLLAGGLAWSGLLTPLGSLLASNWLGLTLTFLITMRLLALGGAGGPLRHAGCLLAASAAPAFVVSARQGLETPLHLAIILWGILLLWRPYTRWVWAALAAAVISKIDAAPVAAAIGLLALAKARGGGSEAGAPVAWGRLCRDAVSFGLLPVAAWATLCFALFGSPLPQTAYAKLRFHAHPEGFLPFLQPLHVLVVSLGVAGLLAAGLVALRLRQGRARALLHETAPAVAALALLGLYCAYNPEERMVWYYAAPQYLVLVQAVLAAGLLAAELSGRWRRRSAWIALGGMVAVALPAWPATAGQVAHMFRYQRICEAERIAVGQLVGEWASPGDTLAVGLGHVAREAGLYTWDLSGLNSPAITALQARGADPLRELRFQWHAGHGLLGSALQADRNLRLAATRYDISAAFGLPACRVMRLVAPESLLVARPVRAEAVRTGTADRLRDSELLHVRGDTIELAGLGDLGEAAALAVGLARAEGPLLVGIETADADGEVLARHRLAVAGRFAGDPNGAVSMPLKLPLPAGAAAVRFTRLEGERGLADEAAEMVLLEPVLLLSRERGRFVGVQFLAGWLPAEYWGCWALTPRAELNVAVPEGASDLRLEVAPWPELPQGPAFRVSIDGDPAGEFSIRGAPWVWQQVSVPLPPGPGRTVHVVLDFTGLQEPASAASPSRGMPVQDVRVH